MSVPPFHPERLEELLFLSAGNVLTGDQREEINTLLREHAEARSFAARSLFVDSLLVDSLATDEARGSHQMQAAGPVRRTHPFARAAAWIGAFLVLGEKSQAAANGSAAVPQITLSLLMKKTLTSLTAAILVLGSAGTYAIHHHNQSTRQRVAGMETEIESLSDRLGIRSNRPAVRDGSGKSAGKSVGIVQVQAIYEGDKVIDREEAAILEQFQQQLAAMDAEALRNLLLDAEKISNPVNGRVAESILKALILLDPAEAVRTATLLSGRSSGFNFLLSVSAAQAFDEWLKRDPASADAWYRETLAAGGLSVRSVPPNGLEEHAIDRSFERLRFKAMVKSNPAVAEGMLATMLPADVTRALREVNDPNALRAILPKLAPEQRVASARGVIETLAAKDPNAAHAWAKSLELPARERDTLMAEGIKNAVASGKLDLVAVSEWTRKLDLDPKTRSNTQIDAAVSASRIRGNDDRATDWNRVAERIDWLRQEAPAETADRMVGEYLGKLTYGSNSPDQSFKAYEAEVSRRGNPDPALTIAYARYLGMFGIPRFSEQGLKYLKTLPPSEERDHVMEMIEINR